MKKGRWTAVLTLATMLAMAQVGVAWEGARNDPREGPSGCLTIRVDTDELAKPSSGDAQPRKKKGTEIVVVYDNGTKVYEGPFEALKRRYPVDLPTSPPFSDDR